MYYMYMYVYILGVNFSLYMTIYPTWQFTQLININFASKVCFINKWVRESIICIKSQHDLFLTQGIMCGCCGKHVHIFMLTLFFLIVLYLRSFWWVKETIFFVDLTIKKKSWFTSFVIWHNFCTSELFLYIY